MTLTAFFMVEKSMLNPKLGKRMITISPTASYRASTGFWVCMLCVHVSSDTHLYLPPPMPLQKAICFLLQPFHLYRDQIHHIQARCFSKFWKSCFASSETCLLSVGLTSGWRSLFVERRGFSRPSTGSPYMQTRSWRHCSSFHAGEQRRLKHTLTI